MSLKFRIYFWFTIALGVFISVNAFLNYQFQDFLILPVFFLVLFALIGEIYEVEVLPKAYFSVSTAIYVGSLIIGGLPLALIVAIPSLILSETFIRLESFPEKASLYSVFQKISFNTAQIVIAIMAGYLAFEYVGGSAPPFTAPYDYVPPLLSFLTFTVVNVFLVSGVISLTEGANFYYQLKFNLRNLHIHVLSLGVLSILIAVTYASSQWNLFLVAVLLLLVNRSLRGYVKLRKQAEQTFEKVMDLLEKRDPYTRDHSESVGGLSEKIADRMMIHPEEKANIVSAARVHDIGKLGIPDSILLKEDDLNEEEWETMQEHPVISADIISDLEIYDDAVDIVRYEHERWDGSGYPEGLEGEDIPLGSRIVAVADVWDALRTERPYRGPLSVEEARAEIKEMSGVKLDPEVVDALIEVIESKSAEGDNS